MAGGPGRGALSRPRWGCPRSLAVKFHDMLYSLSPDILYSFPMAG
jgi:hypothetical protein